FLQRVGDGLQIGRRALFERCDALRQRVEGGHVGRRGGIGPRGGGRALRMRLERVEPRIGLLQRLGDRLDLARIAGRGEPAFERLGAARERVERRYVWRRRWRGRRRRTLPRRELGEALLGVVALGFGGIEPRLKRRDLRR